MCLVQVEWIANKTARVDVNSGAEPVGALLRRNWLIPELDGGFE